MLKGGYNDFESPVNDVRECIKYDIHLHSYSQGLSPNLAKITYQGQLN